jgi:hypothetical protein
MMSALTFLMFALCYTVSCCGAFLPVAHQLAPSLTRSNALSVATYGVLPLPLPPSRSTTTTRLFMAKPGMSEERARQEREAEIQSKISRMKREGRMKNKDGTTQSAEDSAMLEAEAFFNKPSPRLKWEKSVEERKKVEAEAAAATEQEKSDSSDDEPTESPENIL